MKHIGIFNTSGDVQTAIENETLLNPYVALVSGALDYNGIQPAPCSLGEWSDDGEGNYTFQTLEKWSNLLQIGVLNNVYVNASETTENVPVYFAYDAENYIWKLVFSAASDTIEYELSSSMDDYIMEIWVGKDSEDAYFLYYSWGGDVSEYGDGSLRLYSDNQGFPLSMTTINPLCSDGELVPDESEE